MLPIDGVLDIVRTGEKRRRIWIRGTGQEFRVKFAKSMRLKTFAHKGIVCAACGVKATHFALVRNDDQSEEPHLALYAGDVLMTKDHIRPRSKGGSNGLSNLQTMCSPCNGIKADIWFAEGVAA